MQHTFGNERAHSQRPSRNFTREEYHPGQQQNYLNPKVERQLISSVSQKALHSFRETCTNKLQQSSQSKDQELKSSRVTSEKLLLMNSSLAAGFGLSSQNNFNQQLAENALLKKKLSNKDLSLIVGQQSEISVNFLPSNRVLSEATKTLIENNNNTISSLLQNNKRNTLPLVDSPISAQLNPPRLSGTPKAGYLKSSIDSFSQLSQNIVSSTSKYSNVLIPINKTQFISALTSQGESQMTQSPSIEPPKIIFSLKKTPNQSLKKIEKQLDKHDDSIKRKSSSFFYHRGFVSQNKLDKQSARDTQAYSSIDKSFQQKAQEQGIGLLPTPSKLVPGDFFTRRITGMQAKQLQEEPSQLEQISNSARYLNQISMMSRSTLMSPKARLLDEAGKSLHSQVAAAFSDVPRNRADLKGVIKWFETVKKENEEKNKDNLVERRKRSYEIIQASLKELRQQIKIDFAEREQFFSLVWEENEKYYKSFLDDFELVKMRLQTDSDSEFNRINDFYKEYIKTKDAQTEEAWEQKRMMEGRILELQYELNTSARFCKNYQEEQAKYKKISIFLKKKLGIALKEIENMKNWQEERLLFVKQQFLQELHKEQSESSTASARNNELLSQLMDQLNTVKSQIGQNGKHQTQKNGPDSPLKNQTKHTEEMKITENDENENDESAEEDNNFVFEYEEGGDLVQGVDQLNTVIVNNEQEVATETKETQVESDLKQSYEADCSIQTDLELLDHKYDSVMINTDTMDEVFEFYIYKQQLDQITKEEQSYQDIRQFKKDSIVAMQLVGGVCGSMKSIREDSSSSSSLNSSVDSKDQNNQTKKEKHNKHMTKTTQRGSQSAFDSNRLLALQLEQYIGAFLVENISQFGDRDLQQKGQLQQRASMFLPETNPLQTKKRAELKLKVASLLETEQIKKLLAEGGLKVVSATAEGKLDKFIKVYSLLELKNKQITEELKEFKRKVQEAEEQLKIQLNNLNEAQSIAKEQGVQIVELEEKIQKLEAELMELREKQKENNKNDNANQEETTMKNTLQPRIFKQSKNNTKMEKSVAFQLGKKVNMEWEFQKQQKVGQTIVEKAKDKKMAKFHNFMTVKTLLKQITMLYNERLAQTKENSSFKDIVFSNFVYNYYSSQYGVKKIADQKFLILVLSVKKYEQILRVNVFSKFLWLSEGTLNYSTDELNKYIDVLDFIMNISQAGTNYTNNESEQRFIVPFIKAMHYISQFGDSKMKPEENAELRKDLESMKIIDINKISVIDFDQYMSRLLVTYRVLVNRAKQYVINAFNACDLDGNRKCNFQEWSMLNRHIEPAKFDDDQLVAVFEQSADILDEEGEKNLSFDKFAVTSLEYELFTDEAQDRYLEITNVSQLNQKFDVIMSKWTQKKQEFQELFKSLVNIDQNTRDEWLTIIDVLGNKLDVAIAQNTPLKPLLIAYNILDKESHMLEIDNKECLMRNSFTKIPLDPIPE